MDELSLPTKLAQQMIEQANLESPNECCGVLAGNNGAVTQLYPATNVEKSPVKYTIDPEEMRGVLRQAELSAQEILGFYHSHTSTEAYPSPTDIKLAPPSDLFDFQYVIVSLAQKEAPKIRAFRITHGDPTEVVVVLTS